MTLTPDQLRAAEQAVRLAESAWQRASPAEQCQMRSRERAVAMAVASAIARTTPQQGF